jgi:hypothetical protein
LQEEPALQQGPRVRYTNVYAEAAPGSVISAWQFLTQELKLCITDDSFARFHVSGGLLYLIGANHKLKEQHKLKYYAILIQLHQSVAQ